MPEQTPRSADQPRWITDEVQEKAVRQPLTRRRVVLEALALTEQEGMGALTMRRVAAALDVTPMSLYNHVADKAELLDLMLDYVIGDVVRASADDTGAWEERLRAVATRNHDLWHRYPVFAEVYLEGVTIGPHALANIERIIGILREAGLNDQDAADAFYVLWHFSIASILVGRAKPVDRSRRDRGSDRTPAGLIETYFSALPTDEIPNVVAVAGHLVGNSFQFGLDLIISGLRVRIEATRPTVRRSSTSRRRTAP